MPLSCDAINDLAQNNQSTTLDIQNGDFTGGNLQVAAANCQSSLQFQALDDTVQGGNIYSEGSVNDIPSQTISLSDAVAQGGGGNKKRRKQTNKRQRKNKSKKKQKKKRQTRKRKVNKKIRNKRKTKSR